MSYNLERTEEDAEVKKAVDEVQGVYDAHGKREWVEWVGKMLMPHMHVQMVMERADVERVEQDTIDKEQIQAERAQREEEQAAKEAELEEREAKYIRQLNEKVIDMQRFGELIEELDMERVMGESGGSGNNTGDHAGRGGRGERAGGVSGRGTGGG
jgi:hypothetical protein